MMKRLLALASMAMTLCGTAHAQIDFDEYSDVELRKAQDCPLEKLTVAALLEGADRYVRTRKGENEALTDFYKSLSCVTIGDMDELVSLIASMEYREEERLQRRDELVFLLTDYAGRFLNTDLLIKVTPAAKRGLMSMVKRNQIYMSSGAYLRKLTPRDIKRLTALPNVEEITDVVDQLHLCRSEAMLEKTAAQKEGDDPSRLCPSGIGGGSAPGGTSGTSGGSSGGGSSGGSASLRPGGTAESFAECAAKVIEDMAADKAVCFGTLPDTKTDLFTFNPGETVGVSNTDFCKVAGKPSAFQGTGGTSSEGGGIVGGLYEIWKARKWSEASAEARKAEKAAGDAQSAADAAARAAAQAERTAAEERKKADDLLKNEGPTQDAADQKKKADDAEDAADAARTTAEDKQTEADKKQKEAERKRMNADGYKLCEAESQTCRDSCSPGQGEGVNGLPGFAGASDSTCGGGMRRVSNNDGAMDPPKTEVDFNDGLLACMGIGGGKPDFSGGIDTQCDKMLCESGNTSVASSSSCTCGGGRIEDIPYDAFERCSQAMLCEQGQECSCQMRGGGTQPLPVPNPGTFDLVTLINSDDGELTGTFISADNPPVDYRDGARPEEMPDGFR